MFIILHITPEAKGKVLPTSMINNFNDCEYFYFQIPRNTTTSEKHHFSRQARLFFQSQFSEPDNLLITEVRGKSLKYIGKNGIKAKELSWEIFYQFNKFVKVREGIFDENLNISISGFIGKIVDFYNDDETSLFLISFTSESIKTLPLEFFKLKPIHVSPFFTILESDFLLPISDYIEDINDERKKLSLIEQILGSENGYVEEENSNLPNYLAYWGAKIQTELDKLDGITVQTNTHSILTWNKISSSDTKYGLWGTFQKNNVETEIPLMDIDKIHDHQKLNNFLQEYKIFMRYLCPM